MGLICTFRKVLFRLRMDILTLSQLRKYFWVLQGMSIGENTKMPRAIVTWPHRVKIGRSCRLEPDIYWHFDGAYGEEPTIVVGDRTFIGTGCEFNISASLSVGSDCLIAAGCRFIDHDHGTGFGAPMNSQVGIHAPIVLESDVWIGANCVVLKGVHVGSGAIVAAGSVVTHSIPKNTIVAGVPARVIRVRT
jgi:acetyltransferase-like isoleucine patch superfamily enzyme